MRPNCPVPPARTMRSLVGGPPVARLCGVTVPVVATVISVYTEHTVSLGTCQALSLFPFGVSAPPAAQLFGTPVGFLQIKRKCTKRCGRCAIQLAALRGSRRVNDLANLRDLAGRETAQFGMPADEPFVVRQIYAE